MRATNGLCARLGKAEVQHLPAVIRSLTAPGGESVISFENQRIAVSTA
jgi:hypothetical protein